MGASLSKTKSGAEIINKSITEVIVSNSSSCSQSSSGIQSISISDIKLKYCPLYITIDQSNATTMELTCLNTTVSDTELQNQFKSNLEAKVASEIKGLNFGLSKSQTDNMTSIVNEIQNKINIQNIAQLVQNSINEQIVSIDKIEVECYPGQDVSFNINQTLILNNVAKMTNKNANAISSINTLDNFLKTETSSKIAGLESNVVLAIIIVVVLSIIISIISSIAN